MIVKKSDTHVDGKMNLILPKIEEIQAVIAMMIKGDI